MDEYNTWYFLGCLLQVLRCSKDPEDRQAATLIEGRRKCRTMRQQVARGAGWFDMAVLISKQRARRAHV